MDIKQKMQHIRNYVADSPYEREPKEYDVRHAGISPSCGDRIVWYLVFHDKNTVAHAYFTCEGSLLTRAAAAVLSEKAAGARVVEVCSWDAAQIQRWLDISVGPTRERSLAFVCKTLCEALRAHDS